MLIFGGGSRGRGRSRGEGFEDGGVYVGVVVVVEVGGVKVGIIVVVGGVVVRVSCEYNPVAPAPAPALARIEAEAESAATRVSQCQPRVDFDGAN